MIIKIIVDSFSVDRLIDKLTQHFSNTVTEIPVKSRYFITLREKILKSNIALKNIKEFVTSVEKALENSSRQTKLYCLAV